MTPIEKDRSKAIAELMHIAHAAAVKGKMTHTSIDPICSSLKLLAARSELWQEDEYPEPEAGNNRAPYLVGQHESGLSLYLNIMRAGNIVRPHNHTTWACIAAVDGAEYNTLFRRLDDGSKPGIADIKETKVVKIEPGVCLAMLDDDIHSVEIKDGETIRHLHFYGMAVDTIKGRLRFNMANGTCELM